MKFLPRKSCKMTIDPGIVPSLMFRETANSFGLSHIGSVRDAFALLKNGKYASFLELTDSWAGQQYQSSREHRAWNQLACLLKKYPFDDPSLDRRGAALSSFWKAERRCKRYNQIFRLRREYIRHDLTNRILNAAREQIYHLLGEKPNMRAIYDMCDFGPGASIGTHGDSTSGPRKLDSTWTVTPGCAPYAAAAMQHHHHAIGALAPIVCYDPQWISTAFHNRVKHVGYNNIVCVPKTAKTDRTIAIEPLWNTYVQKGIDTYMRKKLRAWGIDLRDQEVNQKLAMQGSMDSSFATIDLSSASDSISIELVRELLPPEWFVVLNAVRSHSFNIEGKTYRYEKFCSMGNGFCFPLETLIFASVVRAVYEVTGDSVYAVYGDDIIVQQSSALLVIEGLTALGFRVNVDKTFIHGPFRESCGADYYHGVDVRPYYYKTLPVYWHDLFRTLNGLWRKGLHEPWLALFRLLPAQWRFLRPFDCEDDRAITTHLDRFMSSPFARWRRDQQRWSYPVVTLSPCYDFRKLSEAATWYGLLQGSAAQRGSRIGTPFRRRAHAKVSFI